MGRKQRRNRLPKAHPKFNAPRETPAGIWPGDRTRFLTLAGIALVAVLTFGIYGQTVSVPTIDYEDSFYLVRNPYVNVPDPFSRLVAVWTEPYFANFHPVTTTTWLVDRAFADRLQSFDAYPFRITHLLYATTGAALLIVLFLQLGLPPLLAVTGAFLFAVHPIHTEVVAWLSARKDLMALIALVLACICYLRARESRTPAGWRLGHFLAGVLSLLAVLSKPIAVIAPALFLAYEFCTARPSAVEGRLSPIAVRALELSALFFIAGGGLLFVFREILSSDPGTGAWLMVVPLVLAAGLFFVAPDSSQLESFRSGTTPGFRVIGPPMLVHSVIFATGSAWTFWAQSAAGAIKGGLSLLPTLNLTFDAMLTYIGKTFIPVHMSASYGWISYPYLSLRGGLGAFAIFGLSVAAFRLASASQRQLRMVAFGIFWFLIAFIPVSNLVPTSTKMADRYLFLPTIGAILAVLAVISWLAANKKSRQFVAFATLALVVIGYTGWAYMRTEVWCGKTTLWKGKPHPDLSLWTAAVETHPDNSSALTSLALVYLNFNPPEAERALVYLQRALEISEIQQQGLPDGKQLDISPLQQAMGNAHLALARGSLSQPGVPDGRAKKKESLRQALKYFERAERVPWGFAPAHARLLQNLAEAREELARMYQEEILAASGPQRNSTVTERDALRAGAINALEEARLVLLKGGVSTQDPDFRAVMLAPGTFYFNREVGSTPEEKLAWYRKALPVYQEAGKLFPDDPRPVLYEGLCFQRLCTFAATPEEKRKDFNRAEAAFRKALTLQTQSSDYQPLMPYRALASLYSEAGDLRAALDFLKKVQQMDPEYSQSVGVDRDIQTLERALRR